MGKRNCFIGAAIFFLCSLVTTSVAFAGNGNGQTVGPVNCTWADPADGPHLAISGEEVILKAAAASMSTTLTYQWDFNDGTQTAKLPVPNYSYKDNNYNIEALYTYTGKVNDKFIATVTVWDNTVDIDGNPVETLLGTDTYEVRLEEDLPETKRLIAIENGLWYIHTNVRRYTEQAIYGGQPSATIRRDWDPGQLMSTQTFIDAGFLVTGDPANPYTDDVQRLLNWAISYLGIMPVTDTDAGYGAEDRTDGGMKDGLGVYFASRDETEFTFGPALKLIATAGFDDAAQPGAFWNDVNFSARVDQALYPDSPVVDIRAWTYHEIVQQMVDWLAWAQLNGVENACAQDLSMRECSEPMTTVCYRWDDPNDPELCTADYERCYGTYVDAPPKKICDDPDLPVQAYNKGSWPFYVEGWGRKLPGDTYHIWGGDGTYGDAALAQWNVSGIKAAEDLGIVIPTYLKTEVKRFILDSDNMGSEGEIKMGAGENIKDVGRAGIGLSLMNWTGVAVTDPRVLAQKNFINNNWDKDNYITDQYYHEADLDCADNLIDPNDQNNVNCYSHFVVDYYQDGYFDAQGGWVMTWSHDKLNILSFLNITEGLNSYDFSGETIPTIDPEGFNYKERYLSSLVKNQWEDGSWTDKNWGWSNTMGTGWAVQTLLKIGVQ